MCRALSREKKVMRTLFFFCGQSPKKRGKNFQLFSPELFFLCPPVLEQLMMMRQTELKMKSQSVGAVVPSTVGCLCHFSAQSPPICRWVGVCLGVCGGEAG